MLWEEARHCSIGTIRQQRDSPILVRGDFFFLPTKGQFLEEIESHFYLWCAKGQIHKT